MEVLNDMQEALGKLTDTRVHARIGDFLCSQEQAQAWSDDAALRKEVVFVAEAGQDLHLAVYLDKHVENGLIRAQDPLECLPEFALAAESVSHFQLFCFADAHDRKISQLELELQADIDKFMLALLPTQQAFGNGVAIIQERQLVARSRYLRKKMFEDVAFVDERTPDHANDRRARYEKAHRLAARFAQAIETEVLVSGNLASLNAKLKRFYRLPLAEKVRSCRAK